MTISGEARSLSGGEPTAVTALGWAYARMGRPAAEKFLAFREAAMGLAREGRVAEWAG